MNATKLCVPAKVLDQHLVVLGKTGAGKSSALRHMVEHLLAEGKRVCIVDPKGDWWGLKTSADGKAGGFPVIAFGDFKNPKAQDVPVNDRSGKHVAELVATGNRPCVIAMRGWTQSGMTRFWIDFAGTLFNMNAGELYLVTDEFHNFAPKGKILSPEAGMSLHWSNRLLSEGRGLGIVCLNASQRPQKVHNDSLTSHETLVAMRVIHKADRDAIKDWIDGAGDADKGKEVLGTLAGMPRGEAYVWSPEIGFGPQRVKFPMFTTFDSFAPPQVQRKVSESGWADVDLNAVKERLAEVIEEAKSNDPTALKRRVAELEKQLKDKPATAATVEKRVEVPVVTDAQVARVEKIADRLEAEGNKRIDDGERLLTEAKEFRASLAKAVMPLSHARPHVVRPAISRPAPAPVRRAVPVMAGGGGSDEVGGGGLRRILTALAQRNGLTNRQIGVRAGLSSQSGTFSTYMSKARANGWIEDDGDRRAITDAGLTALGSFDPLPSGGELLAHWLRELGQSGAARILQVLADAYPKTLTNEEIGEAAGISHASGTFSTYMSKLRSLELIQGSRGATKASDEFFT
jgi:hypothetical protein